MHASSPSGPRTGQSTSPLWSQAGSEPRASRQHPRMRPTRETRGLPSYLPPTAPLSRLPLQVAGAGAEQTIEAPSPPPTPSCRSLQPPSISNETAPPPAPLATLLHSLVAPVFSPLPPPPARAKPHPSSPHSAALYPSGTCPPPPIAFSMSSPAAVSESNMKSGSRRARP